LHARFGYRETPDGRPIGGWIRWKRFKAGLFYEPPKTIVFGSTPVYGGWEVGFQSILKRQNLMSNFFQSLSVGTAGICESGRIKVSLNVPKKEIAMKWKNGIQIGEVALIVVGNDFGQGKWRFGISICHTQSQKESEPISNQ
jgi:hypothetical protein